MTEILEGEKASTREECLVEVLAAMAAADKWLRRAIVAELAEGLPVLEQAEADAAAALEGVYATLRGPETDLAGLDEQIAGKDADLASWRLQLDRGDTAAKVAARPWVRELEAELADLRAQRDFAAAQLLPGRDALDRAKRDLEDARVKKASIEMNARPELAYFGAGKRTSSYSMRFGFALEAALGDAGHLEHDAAVDYMLHLCRVSAFRTEDYANELPSDAMTAKRFWDSVYADANPPTPAPSGREVIEALNTEMTVAAANKALERSKVEDRRHAGPPGSNWAEAYIRPPR